MEEGGGWWRSWWGSGGAEGVRREPVVAVVVAVPVLLQALVGLGGLVVGLFVPVVVVVVAIGGRCRPIESIVKRFHRLPPSLPGDVNGTTSPPVLTVVPSSPAPSPCPSAVPVPAPAPVIVPSIISDSTKACGDGCCDNANTAEVR